MSSSVAVALRGASLLVSRVEGGTRRDRGSFKTPIVILWTTRSGKQTRRVAKPWSRWKYSRPVSYLSERPRAEVRLTRALPPTYLDAMSRKVLITSRAPTLEETAREIGLSQRKARKIAAMMDAIVERRLRGSDASARGRRAARNGGGAGPKRGVRARTRTSRS